MPEDKLTISQFAQKVKAKYPQYKDINDTLLTQKIIDKYPQYKNTVDFGEPKVAKQPVSEKPFDFTDVLKPRKDDLEYNVMAANSYVNNEIANNPDVSDRYIRGSVRDRVRQDVEAKFNPQAPLTDNTPIKRRAQEISDKFSNNYYEQISKNQTPEFIWLQEQAKNELYNNPELQKNLVQKQLKETKSKKYNDFTAARFLVDQSTKAIGEKEKAELVNAAEGIKNGKLDYINGHLVEPLGAWDFFWHSKEESEKAQQGYDEMVSKSPEEIIAKMESERKNQNVFSPIKVPEDKWSETVGGVGGLPWKGLVAATVTGATVGAIPGAEGLSGNAATAVGAWLTSDEMSRVAMYSKFNEAYNEIRDDQQRRGVDNTEQAYSDAMGKAMVSGIAAYGMGIAMGQNLSKLNKIKFSNGAIDVLKKSLGNIGKESLNAVRTGAEAAAITGVEGLVNNDKDILQKMWESGTSMAKLHLTLSGFRAAIGHASTALGIAATALSNGLIKSKGEEKIIKLNLAKQPEEEVNKAFGEAIVNGTIKPEDANQRLSEIKELKEHIKAVPDGLTDDATLRIADLDKMIAAKEEKIKELPETDIKAKAEDRKIVLEKEIADHISEQKALLKQKAPKDDVSVTYPKKQGKEITENGVTTILPEMQSTDKVSIIKPGEINQHETTTIGKKETTEVPNQTKAESADIGKIGETVEPTEKTQKQINDAIQESGTGGVLPHSQEGTGKAGGERSGVGQGEQGNETATKSAKEKPSGVGGEKEKIESERDTKIREKLKPEIKFEPITDKNLLKQKVERELTTISGRKAKAKVSVERVMKGYEKQFESLKKAIDCLTYAV